MMSTSRRDHLDDLLQAWGDQQRLPDEHADAIRRAIVADPRETAPHPVAGMSADWWLSLSAQVTDAIVQANDQAGRTARALAPTGAG